MEPGPTNPRAVTRRSSRGACVVADRAPLLKEEVLGDACVAVTRVDRRGRADRKWHREGAGVDDGDQGRVRGWAAAGFGGTFMVVTFLSGRLVRPPGPPTLALGLRRRHRQSSDPGEQTRSRRRARRRRGSQSHLGLKGSLSRTPEFWPQRRSVPSGESVLSRRRDTPLLLRVWTPTPRTQTSSSRSTRATRTASAGTPTPRPGTPAACGRRVLVGW